MLKNFKISDHENVLQQVFVKERFHINHLVTADHTAEFYLLN